MTEYEKLSLTLLAAIAHGQVLRLQQPTSPLASGRAEHGKVVDQWTEQVNGIVEAVAAAVRSKP